MKFKNPFRRRNTKPLSVFPGAEVRAESDAWNREMDEKAWLNIPMDSTKEEVAIAESKRFDDVMSFYRDRYHLPLSATLADVHKVVMAAEKERITDSNKHTGEKTNR